MLGIVADAVPSSSSKLQSCLKSIGVGMLSQEPIKLKTAVNCYSGCVWTMYVVSGHGCVCRVNFWELVFSSHLLLRQDLSSCFHCAVYSRLAGSQVSRIVSCLILLCSLRRVGIMYSCHHTQIFKIWILGIKCGFSGFLISLVICVSSPKTH